LDFTSLKRGKGEGKGVHIRRHRHMYFRGQALRKKKLLEINTRKCRTKRGRGEEKGVVLGYSCRPRVAEKEVKFNGENGKGGGGFRRANYLLAKEGGGREKRRKRLLKLIDCRLADCEIMGGDNK